jgi:hypothetical protein
MTRALLGLLSLSVLIAAVGPCRSEIVDVKYRGSVDLAPFKCESMGRYFNGSIKGHFDCQTGRAPSYR